MKVKRIDFGALFDHLGKGDVCFSDNARILSGDTIQITGYVSPVHDGSDRLLLVNSPGECPDCSPAPVAAIYLPGFAAKVAGTRPVRIAGRIEFGFEIDPEGNATFLRLIDARIATGLTTLAQQGSP